MIFALVICTSVFDYSIKELRFIVVEHLIDLNAIVRTHIHMEMCCKEIVVHYFEMYHVTWNFVMKSF